MRAAAHAIGRRRTSPGVVEVKAAIHTHIEVTEFLRGKDYASSCLEELAPSTKKLEEALELCDGPDLTASQRTRESGSGRASERASDR